MQRKPRILTEKAKRAMARMTEIAAASCKRDGMDWLPTIQPGTPQWSAWKNWRKEHDLTNDLMERLEGHDLSVFTVCSEYPPVGE